MLIIMGVAVSNYRVKSKIKQRYVQEVSEAVYRRYHAYNIMKVPGTHILGTTGYVN